MILEKLSWIKSEDLEKEKDEKNKILNSYTKSRKY